jgi:hypothetical protein
VESVQVKVKKKKNKKKRLLVKEAESPELPPDDHNSESEITPERKLSSMSQGKNQNLAGVPLIPLDPWAPDVLQPLKKRAMASHPSLNQPMPADQPAEDVPDLPSETIAKQLGEFVPWKPKALFPIQDDQNRTQWLNVVTQLQETEGAGTVRSEIEPDAGQIDWRPSTFESVVDMMCWSFQEKAEGDFIQRVNEMLYRRTFGGLKGSEENHGNPASQEQARNGEKAEKDGEADRPDDAHDVLKTDKKKKKKKKKKKAATTDQTDQPFDSPTPDDQSEKGSSPPKELVTSQTTSLSPLETGPWNFTNNVLFYSDIPDVDKDRMESALLTKFQKQIQKQGVPVSEVDYAKLYESLLIRDGDGATNKRPPRRSGPRPRPTGDCFEKQKNKKSDQKGYSRC